MAVDLGYQNVYRYPRGYPEWHARKLPVGASQAGLEAINAQINPKKNLQGWDFFWTLLGIFAGGIALNLTPCVYPLIPITVSYFSGKSGQKQMNLLIHGASYIGGLAVTNSILGVTAALTGGLMGALLQNPIVLLIVAAVLILFAASLFGFWEMRMPYWLNQAAGKSYSGYFGSLFMGITLGVVAAPCIGPFVLGLLTWVASLGDPRLGFLIFFTLSIGLGLPLFILAMFSGKIDKLPRSGEWMLWVRKLMGWVLIAMAAYFIRPVLPVSVGMLALTGVIFSAGLHLGWFDKTKSISRGFDWGKTGLALAAMVSTTALMGSWLLQGPGVAWQPYTPELLAEAKKLNKPVIIDFYADWCSPCRELEEITFHDRDVVKQAGNGFVTIKVDLTRKGNPDQEQLLGQYKVKGVPTVVFLDGDGNEHSDLRLLDFVPPDQFLNHMAAALTTSATDKSSP